MENRRLRIFERILEWPFQIRVIQLRYYISPPHSFGEVWDDPIHALFYAAWQHSSFHRSRSVLLERSQYFKSYWTWGVSARCVGAPAGIVGIPLQQYSSSTNPFVSVYSWLPQTKTIWRVCLKSFDSLNHEYRISVIFPWLSHRQTLDNCVLHFLLRGWAGWCCWETPSRLFWYMSLIVLRILRECVLFFSSV